MYTEIVQKIHNEFNNSCEKFKKMSPELPDIGLRIQNKVVKLMSKYPLNKIITKNAVLSICKKYNLILADISNFAGFIPEKNLDDLRSFNYNTTFYEVGGREYLDKSEAEKYNETRKSWLGKPKPATIKEVYKKGDFFICAPRKDFILREEDPQKIDYSTVADPIVLFSPYEYNNDVMVVVTAWGEEANDVVNEKMN